MTQIVNRDRELAVGSPESGVKLKISDAKGPTSGSRYYLLCPDCNKVVYSIWRDGPMADETRNTYYCTCDGKQDMSNQQQTVTVLDVEDVAKPKEAKEFRAWLENQKQ
jgi:hypothetical protein